MSDPESLAWDAKMDDYYDAKYEAIGRCAYCGADDDGANLRPCEDGKECDECREASELAKGGQ